MIVKPATVVGWHRRGFARFWALRLVRLYAAHYNQDRPHMALGRDAPVARAVELSSRGRVVAFPRVAGLHHRYARAA